MNEAGQIYEALAQVMKEINAVGKNKKNQQQGFMYRGIDDAYNALHPLFKEQGIISVPKVLDVKREERQSKSGGNLIYSIATVEYTFFAKDGSSISSVVVGEGMDSADKSMNKAMAVAHKYALLQMFCIPTEDLPDPDAESPDQNGNARPPGLASESQVKRIQMLMRDLGETERESRMARLNRWLARGNFPEVSSTNELTTRQASDLIKTLEKQLSPSPGTDPFPPEVNGHAQ